VQLALPLPAPERCLYQPPHVRAKLHQLRNSIAQRGEYFDASSDPVTDDGTACAQVQCARQEGGVDA
jgi:hypothetical protein